MAPKRLEPNGGLTRAAYLLDNAFELAIAVSSLIICLAYVANPSGLDASAIGRAHFPDVVWNMLFGVGAILTIAGLAVPKPNIEWAGLCMVAAAWTGYAIAVWTVRGLPGLPSILIGFAVAVACLVRLYLIYRYLEHEGRHPW